MGSLGIQQVPRQRLFRALQFKQRVTLPRLSQTSTPRALLSITSGQDEMSLRNTLAMTMSHSEKTLGDYSSGAPSDCVISSSESVNSREEKTELG